MNCSSFILLLAYLLILTVQLPSLCNGSVLVLGATGRTGSSLYHQLKERGVGDVRGLIRSVNKARDVLHCGRCDEREGIYVGDIRNLTSLIPAFRGVRTVAIATGVSGMHEESPEEIRAVEFTGVQNAVRALAQDVNLERFGNLHNLKVVLCSSQGTTKVPSDGMFGEVLFYKLNAEAFLGSVGMVTSVVKPCGLVDSPGRNSTLLALHDDAGTPTGSRAIAREDVARVMAELVVRTHRQNLRFDLCSMEGPATSNLGLLLDSAQWDWQQGAISTTAR